MTRVGGLSIHSGNMMPYALALLTDTSYRLSRAYSPFEGIQWGDSPVIVALQKLE